MRQRRRLFDVAGTLLLVVAVLPFAVAGVPQLVGADRSYTVTSGSMEPAIGTGDVVVVRYAPPSFIEEGDVITYELDTGGAAAERRTHRVVEVVDREDGRYFRTKGDANEDPDPRLVPADAVVGRVVLIIPYVGYVTAFASTAHGVVVLVLVPAGLLFASEFWALASTVRQSQGADEPSDDAPGADDGAGPRETTDAAGGEQ